jgi:hypothetical protein
MYINDPFLDAAKKRLEIETFCIVEAKFSNENHAILKKSR